MLSAHYRCSVPSTGAQCPRCSVPSTDAQCPVPVLGAQYRCSVPTVLGAQYRCSVPSTGARCPVPVLSAHGARCPVPMLSAQYQCSVSSTGAQCPRCSVPSTDARCPVPVLGVQYRCSVPSTGARCPRCSVSSTGARCPVPVLGAHGARCPVPVLGAQYRCSVPTVLGVQYRCSVPTVLGVQHRCSVSSTGARCPVPVLGVQHRCSVPTVLGVPRCSVSSTGAQCPRCSVSSTGARCPVPVLGAHGARCPVPVLGAHGARCPVPVLGVQHRCSVPSTGPPSLRAVSVRQAHNVRLQAQTAEEKEAWIRALSDGINRAKNKVFDEVKVDDSSNLEHVTRTRPKGNRHRRPPTRIHMKEVAGMPSDALLYLDLDQEHSLMSNGTQSENGSTEASREAPQVPCSMARSRETPENQSRTSTDDLHTEPVVCPQKKVIKPPMPPTKEPKPPAPEVEAEKETCPTKRALNVPLPPPKEAKPCVASGEGAPEKTKVELITEDCEDSRKKTSPQTPHSSQLRANGLSENSQPPIPPTQDTKPSMVPDQVPDGMGEGSKSPVTGQDSRELSEEGGHSMSRSPGQQHKKPPGPLVPPKKKPEKLENPGAQDGLDKPDPASSTQAASDLSDGLGDAEEPPPKNQIPSVLVSWVVSLDDDLSAPNCALDEEHRAKAEEKSVDSGQHSDDDSDGSRSGDTLAVSTAAMRGSHAGLDAMDSSEEDLPSLCYSGTLAGTRASSTEDPCQSPEADPRGKISTKSASFGDLMSDCAVGFEQQVGAMAAKDGPPCHDVRKLQAEIFLEIQKTTELLNKAPQGGAGDAGGDLAGSLLDKAMEKLQKAERVLREAKKLKSAAATKRKSW
uniref:Pleckstrin homology domain-containing family O member 2-like n=1 Tax=Takifugu rubripes TaxID=31033 RepID=A0A674MXT5_TAKRU